VRSVIETGEDRDCAEITEEAIADKAEKDELTESKPLTIAATSAAETEETAATEDAAGTPEAATGAATNEKTALRDLKLIGTDDQAGNTAKQSTVAARVSWILCKRVFLTLRHPVLKLDIKPI